MVTENKTSPAESPNCDFDPAWITADEASRQVLELAKPVTVVETVALRATLNRVTAADIRSRVKVPNHTNSAMDGYAFIGADISSGEARDFTVTGASFAGRPFNGRVDSGQCVRIMTGAVMPEGADTVVMQERVQRQGDMVTINSREKTGNNVRYAGEDLDVGDIAITRGTRIGPSHLGLAASLGLAELPVFRKPRVAFFSNGDELRSLGEILKTGELYDSNRYTLFGMLTESNVEMIDLGVVPDDPDVIRQAFIDAADCADLVITSAGASVGDADYVKQILDELGTVSFWKVAIKPGRPLAFGKIGHSLFFGLPGNPVSVMVTFQIFVRQAIRRLAGEAEAAPLRMMVPLTSGLKRRAGRVEYQRGILSTNSRNETVVCTTGSQDSGILHSMSVANCYIILPADSAGASPGDLVEVQPFGQIF
jgi:molybdopterin molybdotransferase